ncbi:pantoate--beta-alanine ligase [Desulforhopalus vacuolatus]|uniref:pantoate--beta-alanine ligase n=1 Tax=Desulforhopalus vacuolatus TaxID=40414 RepID=UPI00196511DF|nr:pantoate--beta-alanine ligase [Desulforhopalus vacuolatus]MBM9519386.1 pantoate--beta-alanine ligase [Desulforhopalus vacuolatus]
MNILITVQEVREKVQEWKRAGLRVGLVPTMGYLHEGHASLIKEACSQNDRVIVSDFVNPIQFGPGEDLDAYPRDIEHDRKTAQDAGADCIFHPDVDEMYGSDFSSFVDMTGITENLCGKRRPGHFRGVCTVVSKLFNIVTPDMAYFGEKDAQQLAVIRQMVQDLNFAVQIIGCPIIREPDGLAKSSRNAYLNMEERQAATVLHAALSGAEDAMRAGERQISVLTGMIRNTIESRPLARVDYIEVVDSKSMQPVSEMNADVLIAIAVYVGKIRLIDNFTWKIQAGRI